MRIGPNISSLSAQGNLSNATRALGASSERLASGLRINKASDDAAGLSIASALNADNRVLGQAIRNTNDGISFLNIAQGGLSTLQDILQRQRELATQAASGQYSAKQRSALQAESDALTSEYNRIVETTRFNGLNIFDGSSSTLQLQMGITGAAESGISISTAALLSSRTVTLPSKTTSSGAAASTLINFQSAMSVGSAYFTLPDASRITGGEGFSWTSYNGGVATQRYIWFTVDGVGSDPGLAGSGYQVALSSGMSAEDVKLALFLSPFYYPGDTAAGNGMGEIGGFNLTNNRAGAINFNSFMSNLVMAPAAWQTAGHAFDTSTVLTFSSMTTDYYVWFNDGVTTDPMLANRTGIEVAYNPATITHTNLLQNAVANAITAAGTGLTVQNLISWLRLTNPTQGPVTPSASTNSRITTTNLAGVAPTINAAADTFTVASHGYSTGQRVSYSQGGTYAGGMSAGTYYVIAVDGNTLKLATSLENAQSGIAVDITSQGTGNYTLTPSATTVVTPSISSLNLSSAVSARAALTTVSSQSDSVSSFIASLGASQSRLTSVVSALHASRINVQGAASRIMDADVAAESASIVRSQILQRSAAAVLSQVSSDSALVLKLLR